MKFYTRRRCRLCDSFHLTTVVDLEYTPLANEFVSQEQLAENPEWLKDEFPLYLAECVVCGHIQLPVVVDPERLFSNYVYVSGTSPVFVKHFENYAETILSRIDVSDSKLVVDIGSNDGTLLRFFKQAGARVLGIDPAKGIAKKATEEGITTWARFFDDVACSDVLSTSGSASVVVANNVFAHIDDLRSTAERIKRLLCSSGIFVFEVSYLLDVCQNTLFDTIYHEHLSYHHVGPLVKFFHSLGMSLFDVERVNTHGGSIRCYVDLGERPVEDSVLSAIELEHESGLICPGKPPRSFNAVYKLFDQIGELKEKLRARLSELKGEGKKVAGYGAPAKATTFMYQLGLQRHDLEFIVDDSLLKQGLYTPGQHISVVASEELKNRRDIDYLLILAWNFADPIMRSNSYFSDRGGKFIVPIPEYKEY